MLFPSQQAIYLQIADQVYENILLEKWSAESKIPSIREMAVDNEVNPNTVMRTYAHLQEQGIIYNQRGIGYFVNSDGYAQALKIKKDDFIQKELPHLFKTMHLLKFTLQDLESELTAYQKKEGKNDEIHQ